jgi:hypothetical protein
VSTSAGRTTAFLDEIADLIATGPLYGVRKCCDGGADLEARYFENRQVQYIELPYRIRKYCKDQECQAITNWETKDRGVYFEEIGRGVLVGKTDSVTYKCKNCSAALRCYFNLVHINQADSKNSVTAFTKVGQRPEPEIDPPRDLKLNESDLKLYRRALACRQHSFGIGAVAYLRRVVENSLNMLVDLVIGAYGAENPSGQYDLGALKRSRFEDKTEFAKQHLPAKLTRGGHNPLGILTSFTSDALHGASDEDCISKFDEIRDLFELTYRSLEFQIKEAGEYDRVFGKFTGVQASREQRPETQPPAKRGE